MRICRPTYLPSGRLRPALRRALVAVAAALVPVLAGCGSGSGERAPEGRALTVYSSLPRAGVSARAADAVAAGERLALADAHGRAGGRAVRLVELDAAAPGGEAWDPAAVEANARRAADDTTAVAYVGELDLGASAVSVPVTSAAGLLQVSPGDGLTTLTRTDPANPEEAPERYYPGGRRNFVRLVPTDAQQAATLAAWARGAGARRLAIVRDDRLFGRELAAEATAAAVRDHIAVTAVEEARRGAADYLDLARSVAARSPDAVLYTGLGVPDGERVLAALGRALPGATLYGSSALAASPGSGAGRPVDVLKPVAPPSAYRAPARRMLRRLRAQRGAPVPADALYGYEAMRLVLEAIDAAGRRAADRLPVARAALRPRARRSLLGDYRLEASGDAAVARFAAYRRAGGRLAFLGLRSPPPPGARAAP